MINLSKNPLQTRFLLGRGHFGYCSEFLWISN